MVDLAQEHAIHPTIIVVAMRHIIKKITDHMDLQIKEITDDESDSTVH